MNTPEGPPGSGAAAEAAEGAGRPKQQPSIGGRLDVLHADIGSPDPVMAAAEFLVAAAYDGRDRDVWGGDRALTFWDRFPDRVRTCCYRGPTLGHWWDGITRELGCRPPTRQEDRAALTRASAHPAQHAVLDTLRTQAETLCLRVRLAWQMTRTEPVGRGTPHPAVPTAEEAMF